MQFDGQVRFNFGTPNVWHFYRFVRALATAGHAVALEWTPLPTDQERFAMEVYVSLERPEERGRFLHAMLGLVNLEREDSASRATVEKALNAAGLTQPDAVAADLDALDRQASQLGVTSVPTMYRHGPAVAVALNDAALAGDLERRAAVILDVLDDDGIWSLAKP
ncbi:MAG: hypothetical protein ACR2N7_01255 [Acidimicrobiia bacterium]